MHESAIAYHEDCSRLGCPVAERRHCASPAIFCGSASSSVRIQPAWRNFCKNRSDAMGRANCRWSSTSDDGREITRRLWRRARLRMRCAMESQMQIQVADCHGRRQVKTRWLANGYLVYMSALLNVTMDKDGDGTYRGSGIFEWRGLTASLPAHEV
jgi:hypothetical protein